MHSFLVSPIKELFEPKPKLRLQSPERDHLSELGIETLKAALSGGTPGRVFIGGKKVKRSDAEAYLSYLEAVREWRTRLTTGWTIVITIATAVAALIFQSA